MTTEKIIAAIAHDIPDAKITHHHEPHQDVHVFMVQAPKAWTAVTLTAKELLEDDIGLRAGKILAAKNKLLHLAAAA